MSLVEYISHVFNDTSTNSLYQYQAKHDKLYYENDPQALEKELEDHFIMWMYSPQVKKSQRFGFLDYHMGVYEGDPMDFWEFIKESPKEPIGPDKDPFTLFAYREMTKYVEPKMEWLEIRKEYAYRRQMEFNTAINDTRIEGRKDNKYIESYFMNAFVPEGCEAIMSKEDVHYFLRATFKGYSPIEKPKLLETKGPQITVTRIIRAFYLEHYKKSSEANRYCKMMKDTFSVYNNMTLGSIKSNFATSLNSGN